MRVLADLKSLFTASPLVVQVEKDAPVGSAGQTAINGKFVIPVPPGSDFPISETSYVLNGGGDIDGGDISSEAMAHLLARYPNFGNIYFNPLITDDHVGELDLTATFADPGVLPATAYPTRAQTGRAPGGPESSGQMPNNTAILAQNDFVAPPRPGVLITDAIDIGPYTLDALGNPVGADEFLVWWKLYDFTVSDDVVSSHGATAGLNTPAIRYLQEVDQEPADLEVYISTDGGAAWHQAGMLEPVAFCNKTTSIRLAFINRGAVRLYLTTFAVLF